MSNGKLELRKKRFLNFLLDCDNTISSEEFEFQKLKLSIAQLKEFKEQKINELETLLINNEKHK
jgi:hypothetical protein